jgi:uncharacterized membrane protein
MNYDIILYVHILSATAWIGGSLLLFALGVFLKSKEAQKEVYHHIGPLYGYFESFWLITLVATGYMMFFHYGFVDIFKYAPSSDLTHYMKYKLYIVTVITFLTAVHMFISFKTHLLEKSLAEKIISRGSSLMIFVLNIVIIWYALNIRNLL